VNLFHGRVREGRAWIGDIAVDLEHLEGVDDVPAPVCARPHEIDIDRHPNGGGIEVVVRDVRPLGDVVRIELKRPDGTGASRSSSRASVTGSRGSPRASVSISGRAIRRYFSKAEGRRRCPSEITGASQAHLLQ
jgi:hypothetical protein